MTSFLIDAQLPPALARWIASAGQDCRHVGELGRQLAECDQRKSAAEADTESDASDREYDQHWSLRETIAKTPALTIDGLRVKVQAACLASNCGDDPFFNGALDRWESIARDLGATEPSVPTVIAQEAQAGRRAWCHGVTGTSAVGRATSDLLRAVSELVNVLGSFDAIRTSA